MRICVEPGCSERVVARSRCGDHHSALVIAEARAIARPRRRLAREERERQLFLETRKARLEGDQERRAFILQNRKLPEDMRATRRGFKTIFGKSLDRTFVSDIELDNGTGSWLGIEYFGDTQYADWPEREKLGVGGRDTSRRRK